MARPSFGEIIQRVRAICLESNMKTEDVIHVISAMGDVYVLGASEVTDAIERRAEEVLGVQMPAEVIKNGRKGNGGSISADTTR